MGQNAAGFIVHGDNGAIDFFCQIEQGFGDGLGDGQFVAGDFIDFVFDPL